MAYSKKEREEYNRHREYTVKELGIGKNEYNALRRVSHKLSEAGASYANARDRMGKEYGEKHYGKDVGSAFAKTKALKKKLKGLHFYHQTDPRGVALYAGKKRMSAETYHREGRPIY